jgi:hypothetical protein
VSTVIHLEMKGCDGHCTCGVGSTEGGHEGGHETQQPHRLRRKQARPVANLAVRSAVMTGDRLRAGEETSIFKEADEKGNPRSRCGGGITSVCGLQTEAC